MTTLDFRTAFDGAAEPVDPYAFVDEHVGELIETHGHDAGIAAARLGLAPLTLDVENELITLEADTDRLVIRHGDGGTNCRRAGP